MPITIMKRNGKIVPFERSRIYEAMRKCFLGFGRTGEAIAPEYLDALVDAVVTRLPDATTVEHVQDVVEQELIFAEDAEAAKAYILYRNQRTQARGRVAPIGVQEAFAQSAAYFPTPIQQFQFFDKYSRFNYELGRRETWVETVDRTTDFLYELAGDRLDSDVYQQIRTGIREMRVMPSMRLLAMAGPAARRNNLALFNCSYMPVDSLDAFVEALIISMAGCGVGYSVEWQYVSKLPTVGWHMPPRAVRTHLVDDSTEGWANALRDGLETWFAGGDVQFDFHQVRPAGAPLLVKGGRASGPTPLKNLLTFARRRILARQGQHLRTLDAHDLMCEVGNAAVSGGVRRTALMSLFDPGDGDMLTAKAGDFSRENSQRWNANNSIVWPEDGMTPLGLLEQFAEMDRSGNGEPGIFNRTAARHMRPAWRQDAAFGTNPCGEIQLRPFGLCNLTAAVARPDDTRATLAEKVRLATIIGTIQSLATQYPGLRPIWTQNAVEERLLGVDINGQLDSAVAQLPEVQQALQDVATTINLHYAPLLGINRAAAITCVKPSGNSSQLLNCSSGLHARWAPYYIRNVRVSVHSPIYQVLRDAGVPMDPENGQVADTATTWVIHFPMQSPDGAITRKQRTALEQLDYWKQVKLQWTQHNPSATITYKPNDLIGVVNWVWQNRDIIGGLSFLPESDATYDQMPYEEIDRETYERVVAAFPPIDFSRVWRYESEDLTTAASELACMAGVCDIEVVPRG